MKKLFLILFIILNCASGFCTKYKIYGTDSYKLDSPIDLDFWFNIDSYKIGEVTPSKFVRTSCYWGEINPDETKISFCTNEEGKNIINKVTCYFNSDKMNDILKKLKKYHYLESTLQNDGYIEYTYNDSVTDNKIIAKKYTYRVEVSFISGINGNKKYIENPATFKIIQGSNGFNLYMTLNDALKNATKQQFENFHETNINGIKRIWLKKIIKNENDITDYKEAISDSQAMKIIKANLNKSNYVDSENIICLDFINKNDTYILANYYKTIIWKTDYDNNIISQGVFTDFIPALIDKYHLEFLNTFKEKNTDDEKLFRFNNFSNQDYLEIRFKDTTKNPTKNIFIHVKYSISEDQIKIGHGNSIDEYKTFNKTVIDEL